VSGWRKGITLLTYLYAYAVGYSFYRNIKVQLCAWFLTQRIYFRSI